MAAKITTSSGNTTISFSWVQPTAIIETVLDATAHYLWNNGYGNHGTEEVPIEYANLTNVQKAEIVDTYLRFSILEIAKAYQVSIAKKAAQIAAEDAAMSNNL